MLTCFPSELNLATAAQARAAAPSNADKGREAKPKGDDAVEWYQSTRGLTVDGKAGTETRTTLIKEYMSLDDTSLDDTSAGHDAA